MTNFSTSQYIFKKTLLFPTRLSIGGDAEREETSGNLENTVEVVLLLLTSNWLRVSLSHSCHRRCRRLDLIRERSRRSGWFSHTQGVPEHQGRGVLERVGEPRISPRRGHARLQSAARRPKHVNLGYVTLRQEVRSSLFARYR